MNIDDMEYLISVAEHGNIGRAAEALGLTQPAVTRAVARLESLAGQRLFVRQPKGVTPTPAGEALLRRALRIRVEYDDALSELQQMKTGKLGLLRIGYTPTVDEPIVVGAIRQLMLERPAARLELIEDLMPSLMGRLHDGQLDLLVGPRPPVPDERLVLAPLYEDRLRVVADHEHPLARRDGVRWVDTAAEPWLLPPPHNRLRQMLDQKTLDTGLPPLNVRVEMHSVGLSQFSMLIGTGLLSLWRSESGPALRKLGLDLLDVADLDLTREICFVHRAGAYISPLSQRLQALLREQAQQRTALTDMFHHARNAWKI